MTVEYIDYQGQVEERVKQAIAKWTGLPHPDLLKELGEKLGDQNKMAERPYFEKEAIFIYNAVDASTAIARKLGIIKK